MKHDDNPPYTPLHPCVALPNNIKSFHDFSFHKQYLKKILIPLKQNTVRSHCILESLKKREGWHDYILLIFYSGGQKSVRVARAPNILPQPKHDKVSLSGHFEPIAAYLPKDNSGSCPSHDDTITSKFHDRKNRSF